MTKQDKVCFDTLERIRDGKQAHANKIYVVTSGSYSDYHIEAVFSTEDLAEQYKSESGAEDIEEWVLDLSHSEWVVTVVRMTKAGKVLQTWQRYDSQQRSLCPIFDRNSNIVCFSRTRDTKAAIKATNEKRAQAIALDMWDK